MVELVTPHLVAVGVLAVEALGEVISNALARLVGNELCTRLHYTHCCDFTAQAQPVQNPQVTREERFADMKTRMRVLFQQYDVPALLRNQRGRRASGGTTTDYQYVARIGAVHA